MSTISIGDHIPYMCIFEFTKPFFSSSEQFIFGHVIYIVCHFTVKLPSIHQYCIYPAIKFAKNVIQI
jgi:hypothetical protein